MCVMHKERLFVCWLVLDANVEYNQECYVQKEKKKLLQVS